MAIVADTGAIYALYDKRDANHEEVVRAATPERGAILIPTSILAEVDYLLNRFLGAAAGLSFLDDLIDGVFLLEPLSTADLQACRRLLVQYSDLDVGLADASVMAVAFRLGAIPILTLDQRHFRPIRTSKGKPFVLLPFDQ